MSDHNGIVFAKKTAEYLSNGKTIVAALIGSVVFCWQAFTYVNTKLTFLDALPAQIVELKDIGVKNNEKLNTLIASHTEFDGRLRIAESKITTLGEQKLASTVVPFTYLDTARNNVTDTQPGKNAEVTMQFSVARDDCTYSFYRIIVDFKGVTHDMANNGSVQMNPTLAVQDNQTIQYLVQLPPSNIISKGKARFQSRVKSQCADGGIFSAASPWIPFYVN
jgi:hypothetical protein